MGLPLVRLDFENVFSFVSSDRQPRVKREHITKPSEREAAPRCSHAQQMIEQNATFSTFPRLLIILRHFFVEGTYYFGGLPSGPGHCWQEADSLVAQFAGLGLTESLRHW